MPRGTETLAVPQIVVRGQILNDKATRRTGVPVTPGAGAGLYEFMQFSVAYDGATAHQSGVNVTVKDLSDINADLFGNGLSFPGANAAPDDNQWVRAIRLPPEYDSSRPIIVTLSIIQEA